MAATLLCGDCCDLLRTLPTASVDCVVSDPIYPCIARPYGMMGEADWLVMMQDVCRECRRILKPSGSAIFVVQPNSETPGKTRLWWLRFWLWAGEWWNLVEDAYWWNFTAIPSSGCQREIGLLRRSVKPCVWVGEPTCYRNQDAVLWAESDTNAAQRAAGRFGKQREPCPSGYSRDRAKMATTALERGGVTPFNLLPASNCNGSDFGAGNGHPSPTPLEVCEFWVRYLCPPGGVVLDPFSGLATVGLAAQRHGADYIGIERDAEYVRLSERRLRDDAPLFASVDTPSPAPAPRAQPALFGEESA